MRYRAFASLLGFATVAPLAAAIAHAEPLTIGACEELKTELTRLESADVTRALDEGPEWATKNLSGEQLERAKRYLYVEEIVRFRCPERQELTNGKPPPLPVPAPHRAQKIKETEALAKAEAAKQAEAEKQAEALKAAEAEAAKLEAARQAEADKKAAEAEANDNAGEPGGMRAAAPGGQKPAAPLKAAASLPGDAEPSGVEKSVLKTRPGGEGAPAQDKAAQEKGSVSDQRAPMSAVGIVPGEKENLAKRRLAGQPNASRAEPVQAVPVDARQLKAAQSEAEQRGGQAQADDNSWFSFFRRSFR